MEKVWDIVIVGGGLSGLALAAELAGPEFSTLSVLVLEKRSAYVRDRTWSYWATAPHRYSHLERCQWSSWTVSLGPIEHKQRSLQSPYASIDADNFYQAAVQTISTSSHVTLRMSTCVDEVHTPSPYEAVVTLTSGEEVRAIKVFDARPSKKIAPTDLVQQFEGWEINLDHDVFKPNQVQLMAFEPDPNGLHFFYILPYSPRHALVESTWISPASWQPNFPVEIAQYLEKLCSGNPYSVSYREQGVLNLQRARPHARSLVGLGRNGGALRPSTGYAFIDTLEHAVQLAQSLSLAIRSTSLAEWQPKSFTRPATEHWMDAVFLEVLAQNWKLAPRYFVQLFGTLAVEDTVAFLTGKATWLQRFRVMRGLPAAPFASRAISRNFEKLFR